MDGLPPHDPREHLCTNVQAAALDAVSVLPPLGATLSSQLHCHAQHPVLPAELCSVHVFCLQLPMLLVAVLEQQGALGSVLYVGGHAGDFCHFLV